MDEENADRAFEILEAGGKMAAHPDTAKRLRKLDSFQPVLEAYGDIVESEVIAIGTLAFIMPPDEVRP